MIQIGGPRSGPNLGGPPAQAESKATDNPLARNTGSHHLAGPESQHGGPNASHGDMPAASAQKPTHLRVNCTLANAPGVAKQYARWQVAALVCRTTSRNHADVARRLLNEEHAHLAVDFVSNTPDSRLEKFLAKGRRASADGFSLFSRCGRLGRGKAASAWPDLSTRAAARSVKCAVASPNTSAGLLLPCHC